MTKIIKFYNGGGDDKGRLLEDIWDWDFIKLEHIHDYIQWLFPIIEPNYFNRETPKLLEEDIAEFTQNTNLRKRLITSFLMMLNFYGLNCRINENEFIIDKATNYEERKKNWQTGENHNFLRITRILHCLKTLGCEKLAKAFYDCLIKLVAEDPDKFNFTSLWYWKNAVEELLI